MCTYLKSKRLYVADKDIEVYKIVSKMEGKYYAPFHSWAEYKHNKTFATKLTSPKNLELLVAKDFDDITNFNARLYYTVSFGIHSFKTLESAEGYLDMFSPLIIRNGYIVKAVIPKGSTYYKGYSGELELKENRVPDVIVSNQLKIIQ